jgi:hypothetical protein
MTERELTNIEQAHDRAVVALLNAVPTATEEQAEEVVTSFTALILYTIQAFVPGGNDATDYN